MSDENLLWRLMQSGFREQESRLQIDWMTHTDERILKHLDDRGPATPAGIADGLEKSEEYIADRCRQLAIRELLEGEDDEYRLAERGAAYLAGEIGAEELDDEN